MRTLETEKQSGMGIRNARESSCNFKLGDQDRPPHSGDFLTFSNLEEDAGGANTYGESVLGKGHS